MTTVTIHYDETNKAFKPVFTLLKSLGAVLSRATKVSDDTAELTQAEFYAKIDRAKRQARKGNVMTFGSAEEAKAYLSAL